MPSVESFEMRLRDAFHFAGDRTVFVGEIVGGPAWVEMVRGSLLLDGRPIDNFVIEGEMIPDRNDLSETELRVVSVARIVELDKQALTAGRYRLVFLTSSDPAADGSEQG